MVENGDKIGKTIPISISIARKFDFETICIPLAYYQGSVFSFIITANNVKSERLFVPIYPLCSSLAFPRNVNVWYNMLKKVI